MIVKTEEELAALKQIGKIVAQTVQLMGAHLKPGITTQEIDDIGRAFLTKHGARSAPELVYQFPGATCISVNHEIAHGVPGSRILKEGDMVNIDVSAELDGFFGDTGHSFVIGEPNPVQKHVMDVTQLCLKNAISVVRAGAFLNVIGKTIQATAKEHGCSIILNLGSHGVGRSLHEEPGFIQPYDNKKDRRLLKDGMVITIEPFISSGAWEYEEADDGWTLYTAPEFVTAQYEHSMVVTKTGATILTTV